MKCSATHLCHVRLQMPERWLKSPRKRSARRGKPQRKQKQLSRRGNRCNALCNYGFQRPFCVLLFGSSKRNRCRNMHRRLVRLKYVWMRCSATHLCYVRPQMPECRLKKPLKGSAARSNSSRKPLSTKQIAMAPCCNHLYYLDPQSSTGAEQAAADSGEWDLNPLGGSAVSLCYVRLKRLPKRSAS